MYTNRYWLCNYFIRYAPESLAYWKFSTQSDVWSYGVTLYEMFSRGADPNFVSGDHSLLLTALQQGRRLPCPPLCPRVVYRELMQPCWEAEASQRPSFNALLGTLRLVESQLWWLEISRFFKNNELPSFDLFHNLNQLCKFIVKNLE